jgi:hypothetical protein
MVCDYYYSAINITFDALQREPSIVSKQCDNLAILMKELQMHSGGCLNESLDINGREIISDNIISMGHFSVTVDGLKAVCRGIEVEAMDLESSLNEKDRETTFRAAATIW